MGHERVTGRKARGPKTGEIGYKCQTFFVSLLRGRRKQLQVSGFFVAFFFFSSPYKIKRFLLKFWVAMMTPGFT